MMKNLRYILLFLSIAGFLFTVACDGSDPDPTTAQKISKTWEISSGAPAGVDASTFSITFNASADGTPSTYIVTPGQLSELGMKPNFNSTTNSGSWEFNSAETQITFDPGATESVVSVSNLSENTLTLSWTVPSDIDKNTPTYTYVLVPRS